MEEDTLNEQPSFDNSAEGLALQQQCQDLGSDESYQVLEQVRKEKFCREKNMVDIQTSIKFLNKAEREATFALRKKYLAGEVKSLVVMAPEKKWGIAAIASVVLFVSVTLVGFSAIAKLQSFATAEVIAVADVYEVDVAEANVAEVIEQLPVEQATNKDAGSALRSWLGNSPLTGCVNQLLDENENHYRWVEAIAIAKQETSLCTTGVAQYNNCGGIKSSKTGRVWRNYATKCDGLEDIAFLIERGDYAELTIDNMNGRYCVDTTREENKCAGWSENIMATVNEIRTLL